MGLPQAQAGFQRQLVTKRSNLGVSSLLSRRCRVGTRRHIATQAVLAFPQDTSGSLGRITIQPRSSAASPSDALPAPPQAASPTQSISLATLGCSFIVQSTGNLAVYEESAAGSHGRLVARANLHLPAACAQEPMRLVWQRMEHERTVEAVVQWGSPEDPIAELLLKPPAETGERWCQVRCGWGAGGRGRPSERAGPGRA